MSTTVVVNETTNTLTVGVSAGPAPINVALAPVADPISVTLSPVGAAGPQGPAAVAFEFIQSTPSIVWIINHNLGFKPIVSTYTSGGVEFVADVIHISNNQLQVYLSVGVAGTARLV